MITRCNSNTNMSTYTVRTASAERLSSRSPIKTSCQAWGSQISQLGFQTRRLVQLVVLIASEPAEVFESSSPELLPLGRGENTWKKQYPVGWFGLGWPGLVWIGLDWLRLVWVGLGWLGLVWVGWDGLGCFGFVGWLFVSIFDQQD